MGAWLRRATVVAVVAAGGFGVAAVLNAGGPSPALAQGGYTLLATRTIDPAGAGTSVGAPKTVALVAGHQYKLEVSGTIGYQSNGNTDNFPSDDEQLTVDPIFCYASSKPSSGCNSVRVESDDLYVAAPGTSPSYGAMTDINGQDQSFTYNGSTHTYTREFTAAASGDLVLQHKVRNGKVVGSVSGSFTANVYELGAGGGTTTQGTTTQGTTTQGTTTGQTTTAPSDPFRGLGPEDCGSRASASANSDDFLNTPDWCALIRLNRPPGGTGTVFISPRLGQSQLSGGITAGNLGDGVLVGESPRPHTTRAQRERFGELVAECVFISQEVLDEVSSADQVTDQVEKDKRTKALVDKPASTPFMILYCMNYVAYALARGSTSRAAPTADAAVAGCHVKRMAFGLRRKRVKVKVHGVRRTKTKITVRRLKPRKAALRYTCVKTSEGDLKVSVVPRKGTLRANVGKKLDVGLFTPPNSTASGDVRVLFKR